MIELIIDPNVPPTEKALIPRKTKINNIIKIIPKYIIANVSIPLDIPKYSRPKFIFFSFK